MINQQSEIKKAYVNLSSLRKNLPDDSQIEEKYVVAFHAEIDRLISIGFSDLEDFKVPSSELAHRLTSFNYISGGNETYSSKKYVDKEIFLIKLDAILAYFSISSPEIEIGFKVE